MRFTKPSPSMVVASIALFVSLGGTSVAAVSYARNAGKVDGYDAVKASSSTSKAAGRLVAANKTGSDKGKLPVKHLADVAAHADVRALVRRRRQRARRAADDRRRRLCRHADRDVQRPVAARRQRGSDHRAELRQHLGRLHQRRQARRRPRRRRRVRGPDGTVAQLTIAGSNTFSYHVEYKGRNLLVNGVVRQDGRNTPTASCLVWGTVQEIAPYP